MTLGCLVLIAAGCAAGCAAGEIDDHAAPTGPTGPDIRTPPPEDSADETQGCGTVTPTGTCEGADAVFCDVAAGVVRRIDCAVQGLTCTVDPARGAGCASAVPTDPDPPPPVADACGAVTFFGECSGATARWCEGGAIKELDCAAKQLTCASEVCFAGAACCTTAQVETQCQTLGIYGACGGADANVVRWCDSAGTIHDLGCSALGKTCQLDVCGLGAQCC